jgi:hypothetical protein
MIPNVSETQVPPVFRDENLVAKAAQNVKTWKVA